MLGPWVPHRLKERKVKLTYYLGARALNSLKPGNVVCMKSGPNSQGWTKATVDREVDIRSISGPHRGWPYLQEDLETPQANQGATPNSTI